MNLFSRQLAFFVDNDLSLKGSQLEYKKPPLFYGALSYTKKAILEYKAVIFPISPLNNYISKQREVD